MKDPIEYPTMNPEDDVYDATLELADNIRHAINTLFERQVESGAEHGTGSPNFVLAAMTIVWLEAVHASWSTVGGESAIQLLLGMETSNDETDDDFRAAAHDFLRRSGWKGVAK